VDGENVLFTTINPKRFFPGGGDLPKLANVSDV